jgi:hypothetical protein
VGPSTSECAGHAFTFGHFRLIPARQRAPLQDGVPPARVRRRALAILTVLVEGAVNLVTKERLIAASFPAAQHILKLLHPMVL